MEAPGAQHRNCDVVVVGAGVAGLSCTHALRQGGMRSVVVLEARDRIGGRICEQQVGATHIDIGAGWLHGGCSSSEGGPTHPLLAFLRPDQVSTLLRATSSDNIWVHSTFDNTDDLTIFQQGPGNAYERLSPQERVRCTELIQRLQQKLVDRALELGETAATEIPLTNAIAHSNVLDGEDGSAVQACVLWKMGQVGTWLGSRLDDISLWEWQDMHRSGDWGHLEGSHCVCTAGLLQLMSPVLVGMEIRLGCRVQSIEDQGENGVRLTCSSGAVYIAKHVVVTLSAGCLRHRAQGFFSPDLPSRKVAALHHVRMCTYEKILLRFTDAFWRDRVRTDWFAAVACSRARHAGHDPNTSLFLNYWTIKGEPVIVAFFVAPTAAQSPRPDVEAVVAELEAVLGPETRKCLVETFVTSWSQDELAGYGSYPVADGPEALRELGRPLWGGRLVFAGDACVVGDEGSTHGAAASGIAAAASILPSRGARL